MPEPALKCENNAVFKQNYSIKLFITFKMAYLFLLFWLNRKSRFIPKKVL